MQLVKSRFPVWDHLDNEREKLTLTEDWSSPSPKKINPPSTHSALGPSFTAQTTMMYLVSTPSNTVSAWGSLCSYGYDIAPRPRILLRIDQPTNTLGSR